MPDEAPSGNKAVFELLMLFALPFSFAAEETFREGKPFHVWGAWTGLALGLFFLGITWARIGGFVGERFSEILERVAAYRALVVLGPATYIAITRPDIRYRYTALAVGLGYLAIVVIAYVRSIRRDVDRYVMPRRITKTQARRLREYLSHHPSHALTIKVDPLDSEANWYANQLLAVFKQTQWNVDYNITRPYMPDDGLCIHATGSQGIGKDDPRTILQPAFVFARITVNRGSAVAAGEFKVFLLVGRRPLAIRYREPLLSRVGKLIWAAGNMRMRP
jgi:hypothetical protein